jgi:DNA-binding cell septation regulator SpoVG
MRKKPRHAVENVTLGVDWERRVALASVRIGEVLIKGVAVWRGRNGHLRVFWPSYKFSEAPGFYTDAIELPPELRADVEAAIIAAYKDAKAQKKKGRSKDDGIE